MSPDTLCPTYIQRREITLKPSDPNDVALANRPFLLDVVFGGAKYGGCSLPLELIWSGPSRDSFYRRFYRRAFPEQISFLPSEGGSFHITLREVYGNRFFGGIAINVQGSRLLKVG